MRYGSNPPPNWPSVPPDFKLPLGWEPPTDWSRAPEGWQMWVPVKAPIWTRWWMIVSYVLVATLLVGGLAAAAVAAGTTPQPPTTASEPSKEPSNEPAAEPSDEPSAETTEDALDGPAELLIGDQLPIEGEDGTVGTVTVSSLEVRTGPGDEWSNGPANGRFLVFKVRMECSEGTYSVDSADFYIRTKDGDRFDGDDGNAWEATSQEPIEWEEMNAGEKKKGVLAFDVTRRHGELVYDPHYDGEPIAIWAY